MGKQREFHGCVRARRLFQAVVFVPQSSFSVLCIDWFESRNINMTPRCALLRRRVPCVPVALDEFLVPPGRNQVGNLVDSASSHTLVSKIKPCMSKYKRFIL